MKLFEFSDKSNLTELDLEYDDAFKIVMRDLRQEPGELRSVVEKDRANRGKRILYQHIYKTALEVGVPASFLLNMVDHINQAIKRGYGSLKLKKKNTHK